MCYLLIPHSFLLVLLTFILSQVNSTASTAIPTVGSYTYTIFSGYSPSQSCYYSNLNDITSGIAFYSDVVGNVTGIRFYKTSNNLGEHIGEIWSTSSCSLLASASFSSETATGWQQVTFSSPVEISANTNYIVSYYAPKGNVVYDTNFLTSSNQYSSGPLHTVIANGARYITGNAFPSKTTSNGEFGYTDVVFSTFIIPSSAPTVSPSIMPTSKPTDAPSFLPSVKPSFTPSSSPTFIPSTIPTLIPTLSPSSSPTFIPSTIPTLIPTLSPSSSPTFIPSTIPSLIPTLSPSSSPTFIPSTIPTLIPTLSPSSSPTFIPPTIPTLIPTLSPSFNPTTISPSCFPSNNPTSSPSFEPSSLPTVAPSTIAPTIDPSHYSTNSFNVTQNLVNVNCSDFESDVTAQNAFKLTILDSIIGTGAVLPQVEIIKISCNSTGASRKLMANEAYSMPSITIDYQLSYTSASTEVSVINSIYQAVTETLTSAVSSGDFTTALQAIAEKYGIQILLQASSTDTTSTALSYTITISSTTPSAAPSEAAINKSQSSNGSQTMKVAIIAVACILIAAMLGAGGIRYKYGPYAFKKDPAKTKSNSNTVNIDNWKLSEDEAFDKSQMETTMGSIAVRQSFAFSTKNPLSSTLASSTSSSGWSLQKSQFGMSATSISKTTGSTVNSASKFSRKISNKSMATIIPRIEWSQLELLGNDKKIRVLGQGSFGVIIKAKYNGDIKVESSNVAVKVIMKETAQQNKSSSKASSLKSTELQKQLQLALEEAGVMIDAESKIANKDSIVKVYGVADGIVPAPLLKALNISASKNMEAVGIVMRLEDGGTLDSVIYNKEAVATVSMTKKLRLLSDIARGLAELHSAGIIHGDIKPANVLLSGDDIPLVRLADFGLSIIREDNKQVIESTLAHTSHYKGTPLYSAPEMFINPFLVTSDLDACEETEKVAKASRKTDMYAFAILAWEVLTQSKPFDDIKSETILGVKLHQGHRPSVDKLPSDCPSRVVSMIEKCWDSDRANRRSAVECFAILQDCYNLLTDTEYDIYLSYEMNHIYLGNHVFHRLCQMGYKVCISEEVGVARCKIVIPLLSEHYQADEVCMNEVLIAQQLNPPRPIVPIFLDECQEEWVGNDLKVACQLLSESSVSYDISDIAHDSNWNGDNGASQETNRVLCKELDKLNKEVAKYLGVK